MGTRTLRYSHALALAAVGVLAGILLEGNKLGGAITSGIVSSRSPDFALTVALPTILLMAFLMHNRLPISLSQVAVGATVGAAFTRGIKIDLIFTLLVVSSWLLTPLVGFAVAVILSYVTRTIAKRVGKVITLNV